MPRKQRIDEYISETLDLLEDDRFEVYEDEPYQGKRLRAVAVKGVGLGSQELVFVFARFTQLTYDKLEDFVDDAYAYARQNRKASWPIGMNNLLWVYPVALAQEATDKVVRRICDDHPRVHGFGYIAFPVVYDEPAGEVYFYEGSGGGPLGGRTMNKVRRPVEDYLLPR
jgi:hypothetical protein